MEVEKVTKERDILRKESEAQMWEVEHLEEVCDELEAEKDGVLEEVEKLSKMDEESEREKKALREQVNTLSAKLESLEKLSLEASERPAQPDRYAQRLERMVRMYEELSQFKILSVEEARAEIDSDDDEDEEDEETEEEVVSQDEIDRARRRSVRRQSGVGKGLTKVRMPRLEDVLEHRCEMKGTRGEIQFTLTMPKVQTETSSPNILYTLHVAKDDEGRVMEEDDEELPEYLSGEMTFPRERLIDFFRKTVGWLFSA
ncbi:hypothetical protein BCR33DRAFT_720525 [Rhizoclosmatium globosum]|uniref:Monopolin complex subunit Csm1/Pcs1 C-terminal domain-containing protein n=1 Tax=Rhizoclosmatium globosum TaxID=329046 RepID=A0A1Y2BVS9_9FUNG|nr:hypothetical protein BCR33DRAFT_720525 [Rhizoclosmatium globosum]|eukprot:ORY38870.1 hypothetical protein BCR33DRAFT_720525 [Rhizoclosmatium globosum]